MRGDLRYVLRVFVSLWRTSEPKRRAATAAPAVAVTIAVAMVVYGYVPALSAVERPPMTAVEVLMARSAEVTRALSGIGEVYESEVQPLEKVLLGYRNDSVLARRVAVSLIREGKRTAIPPRMLLAVLLVENPWLDPQARSSVGARGLMQVMPLHQGKWKRCPPSLDGIESNICHGAQIFASYVREERGDVERALLRYNGCVNGTNTPNCHQYATHVFARAGRASMAGWRKAVARTE